MADLARAEELFFAKSGMDSARVERLVREALAGMDDGELFLEWSQSEGIALDDGRIKSASFDQAQGFGLRALSGESAGYAHASELSESAIQRAGQTVRAVAQGHSGILAAPPPGTNRSLYGDFNPLEQVPFGAKTKLLMDIDAYARSRDPRVRQVMASLAGEWRAIEIIRADGSRTAAPPERAGTATPAGSCAPRAGPAAPAGRRAAARRSASAGVSRPWCASTRSSASSASACASLSTSSIRCAWARSTSCDPATQPSSRDRAASAILRACLTSGSRRTASSGGLLTSFCVRSTAHHHLPFRRLAYHCNSVFQ